MKSLAVASPLLAIIILVGCSAQPEVPVPSAWESSGGNICIPDEETARRAGNDEAMMTYSCFIKDGKIPDLVYAEYTSRWNCRSRRLIETSGLFQYRDNTVERPPSRAMNETVIPGSFGEGMMNYACSRQIH